MLHYSAWMQFSELIKMFYLLGHHIHPTNVCLSKILYKYLMKEPTVIPTITTSTSRYLVEHIVIFVHYLPALLDHLIYLSSLSLWNTSYWCSWAVFLTTFHWPGIAGWWHRWAGSPPCRSRWQSEKMSFHPDEILCHYWECQGYHTGQLGRKDEREWERESLLHLNELQREDWLRSVAFLGAL